ncbi:hypothetical protein B0H15DRAFT_807453 [Mycena belliarum]|uniref:Uncharacterized protein n=1 Tax=Mycena belliarum TaxID=1033014 RepID=A0AAD6TMZ5_9AGAR|nr:hypothetical protein B0H15DRAFT_807453 [Mycena belliae]
MLANLQCLTVLENPRVGSSDKPKMFTVDAQIYLNGSVTSLIGCLNWYNEHDFQFPEALGAYKLWIQVDRTFEVHADQYITGLKGPGSSHYKVLIPSTPRYKKQPVPSVNGGVVVTGRITDVERLLDNDNGKPGSVVHFVVDMDTVVFMGYGKGAGADTPRQQCSSCTTAVKTEGTPAQLKFNFSQKLRTPTPSQKQKECGEESTDDKGEGSSKQRSV